MFSKKTIIAAAILSTIPFVSFASGEVNSIIDQISRLSSMVKSKNPALEMMTTPVVDLASQGDRVLHRFIVPGNVEATILGICDNNCSGFGITVIDENDRIVGSDNGMDGSNYAEVKVNSIGSESREVRVVGNMAKCNATSCVYSVFIMTRPILPDGVRF